MRETVNNQLGAISMSSVPSLNSVRRFPEAGLPERLGPPAALDEAQQAAADELINGPRGGVYGPFRPLLHRPQLLHAVGKLGEALRFEGTLDTALREWTICAVARELSNVFEWDMHVPLAAKAGVSSVALAALDAGEVTPDGVPGDLALARTVAHEVVTSHRLTEATYAEALRLWGEPALVELLTLVGYFAMVCWLMNVARTPGSST
jgi:4-carboxymuconolactone decarboxylase